MSEDASGSDGQRDRWGALMARAQEGDAEDYRVLLEEITPTLRKIIHSRIGDHAAAEDVVQNTLLSIHRARHTYRSERPFAPWMRAIARNAVIDSLRESGRRRDREFAFEGIDDLADAKGAAAYDDGRLSPPLVAALERLPASQAEAVRLVQLEGLSVVEAAARAGISVGALKVRAHRGYRALRKALEGGRR